MLSRLYQLNGYKRAAAVWVGFMLILWGAFGIAALMHPGAFAGVEASPTVKPMSGVALFGFIVFMNGIVILLIAGGNIFARFGQVTPGLVVLLVQGAQIGWMAGSNGFETPFATMTAANQAFLRIGLWETSSYALICAATLTKSLLISATFPPSAWLETRKLSDLRFDRQEITLLALAIAMWLGAAIVETLSLSSR